MLTDGLITSGRAKLGSLRVVYGLIVLIVNASRSSISSKRQRELRVKGRY